MSRVFHGLLDVRNTFYTNVPRSRERPPITWYLIDVPALGFDPSIEKSAAGNFSRLGRGTKPNNRSSNLNPTYNRSKSPAINDKTLDWYINPKIFNNLPSWQQITTYLQCNYGFNRIFLARSEKYSQSKETSIKRNIGYHSKRHNQFFLMDMPLNIMILTTQSLKIGSWCWDSVTRFEYWL